jgi:hypothetical protein
MGHVRTYSTRMRLATPLAVAGLTLCRPQPMQARQATPVAGRAAVLDGLLAAAPVTASGGEGGALVATFADLAGQIQAVGAARPNSIEDDARDLWFDAISPLALPEPFRSSPLLFGRNLVGFDLTDVDAALEAGTPPETVVALRGRFDPAGLQATWSAGGYQTLDVDGVAVASLSEEPEIDFGSELGMLSFGRLNNAALLPDGSLVYTPSLEMMKQVIATSHGDAMSLAQRVDIRALLDAQVDDLVTGLLFPGVALAGIDPAMLILDPDAMPAMETQVAGLGEMPPIALGLLGITAGGPLPLPILGNATPDPSIPTARVIYSLLMMLPGTAGQAGEVAKARLQAMDSIYDRKPYRELFASWEATVLADGRVLRLEITLPPGTQAGVWSRQFFARDTLFLSW